LVFASINKQLLNHLPLINRSDDDIEIEQHKFTPSMEASTSSDYFSNPRYSQLHSETSRRKSTPPVRIQQVPIPLCKTPMTQNVKPTVRVRGVIRDPTTNKCLYLLINTSKSS
jgi:hypothetical protein